MLSRSVNADLNRPPSRPYRVLVVDDNRQIHDDFRKILCAPSSSQLASFEDALYGEQAERSPHEPPELHFSLESAFQGQEGLELLERGFTEGDRFALAFVDIRMPPGWDGIETTARLWQVDPELQVVLCTAYSDYSWGQIVEQLGCTDRLLILKKPFDAAEVRQLALALTAKWAVLREHVGLLHTLEAEVEARTRDLAQANEQLRLEMQERLEVEGKVRHLQKIQALGRLSASVGHEINNPLCFVTGNLELIAEGLLELRADSATEQTWTDVRVSLDAATAGATRIAKIVEAMRGFIHADEQDEQADVTAAIAAATALTRNEIRYRARLTVRCEPAPPLRIGQRALEQVLVNLLINAAQAITQGGADDNEIRVIVTPGPDRVGIEISDTGHGIEAEIAEHVFEPFYTTKPVGQGTGLGLPLCHELITAAGGELSLSSELGRGTTVGIALPLAEGRAAAPEREPPEQAEPAGEAARHAKILLVDDDPPILRVLQYALRSYETHLAHNGQEALARCRQESFDVVVCDMMMPDITGMELYERMRESDEALADRFVFITGGAINQRIEQFLRLHAHRCVRKPFTSRQIREAVAQHLVAAPR
jgi:two-component system, NtrC family, sensor kinase